MGEGIQVFDIILFAMIAAFLILRLRSVLGRHRHDGRPEEGGFDPSNRVPHNDDNVISLPDQAADRNAPSGQLDSPAETIPDTPLEAGMTQIQIALRDFDRQEFMVGARTAFEMIIQAFAEGDRELLQSLLSPEVYSNFLSAITSREAANETLENNLVRIVSAEPLEAEMDGKMAMITMKFVTEQINATRDAAGEVVDGDPDHISEITDIWTFAHDTKSRDPNWTLVATRSLD